MTRKVYRTAQGKMVDIGSLQLQYETVRAVGNMGVNARGDLVNADNRPIQSRNKQVAAQYKRQTTNVSDERVRSHKDAQAPGNRVIDVPAPPEDFDDDFIKSAPTVETVATTVNSAPAPAPAPNSGLAAAIARAREVTQEPLPNLKQQHRNTSRRV